MSYQAESQSTINEVLLLIAVLQRIPKNRWVSSTEIRKGLAAEGIDLMPRRLQRFLVALVECEAFHIEVDRRGKPYGYRRNAPDSTLDESSLTPQESLLLRLCQERLKYQLPPCITEAMEPLFSASKTALNENGKSAKTREWLQKVAFVSDTVPMMPPKIKPRIFNAVSEALYRDSKLRVKFHNSRGEENEAVVSPLGLVQQVQRLYLICQFEGYNNIRHLALHRMDEAEVTAFPSVRPQDFSLSQYVASLWGYTVEMTEKSFEKIGIQNIPTCIQIPSLEIYLHITRKRNELDIFIRNWQLITNEMPQLIEWSQRNPLRLISHDTWRDTIKVCKYFTEHPRPHLYIRELPIEVHTKYIEENKDLLKSLLDELLPASTITLNEKTFEKRYGLKCAEPLIRIRFLDSTLAPGFCWTDVSLPLPDFQRLNCACKYVFIMENKMNFLTLPLQPDSIAVWSGGGFNISFLKEIPWMTHVQNYYWGDLDAQGLQILNQFRSYYPSAIALMMDWETFHTYRHLVKEGTPALLQTLPQLTLEEYDLYRFLQENNFRLEQEQIPNEDSIKKIKQTVV